MEQSVRLLLLDSRPGMVKGSNPAQGSPNSLLGRAVVRNPTISSCRGRGIRTEDIAVMRSMCD